MIFRGQLLTSILLCLMIVPSASYALTAEQVLGEYWKDPLFGQAASEHTVILEVLHRRIWPMEVTVPRGKNIRFIVENKTNEAHLIAFADEPQKLKANTHFKQFVEDELYHAEQKESQSAGHHHHHHTSDSAEETQDIVKTLDQRPTIFVLGQEQKEMLITFSEAKDVLIFCALEDHDEKGYTSKLKIRVTDQVEIPFLK